MPFFDPIRLGASGAADGAFTVDRSLKFNSGDSHYLERTPGSAGNRKTNTLSAWFKIGHNNGGNIASCNSSNSDANNISVVIRDDGEIRIVGYFNNFRISTRRLRDHSAWYHIVVAIDTTQSSADNRIKLYINGVQETSFTTSGSVGQNDDLGFAQAATTRIGARSNDGVGSLFDGYITEVNFIDGQALTPSSFAETNAETGQWVPIDTSGLTFGTTGFYLKFADNSGTTATTLGKDSSGNGNNFTPNNFATSDSLTDTPTKNFCTLNFLNKTNDVTVKEGNLEFFQSSNDESATGTFHITSGKWYWEVYKNSGENPELGIEVVTRVLSNKTDDVSPTKVCIRTNGGDQQVGTGTPQSITGSSGGLTGAGVLAIAVDFDNKKIWYSDLSGNFFNSGNPATGANAAFTFSSVAVADECVPYFFCGTGGNNSFNINFGQDGTFAGHTTAGGYADGNGHGNFKYSVPSGYLALCSANLPEPAILLPKKHFVAEDYSGTGSSQNITGFEFQPDWVWIKKRSGSEAHDLQDAIRGATKRLSSNNTSGESTVAGSISSFNSDGFTVVDAGTTNESGHTYISWNWFAGGSTASNSNGTITSQVRVNATAGFSIVSYTGNGSSGATVGHGLGVVPDQIIIRRREGDNWMYYSHSLNNGSSPQNYYLELNEAGGQINDSRMMNNTAPTSTVFSLRADTSTNGSGATYIAYCFSEVVGYSKFGRYTGNGNSNGTFVMTGFRPSLIILKCRTASESWRIFDYKRSPINQMTKHLFANNDNQESTETGLDFLSNGFKFRDGDTHQNGNGEEYIYWAFAESPFKNARAR
jgi:hypothetical protein